MTTLQHQYFTLKEKYKDAILLFRVGDFYETFNRDAEILSSQLELTSVLTEQNPDIKAAASLPFYSLNIALRKLVKAGYRVGVCDPLELPKAEPNKRGITDLFKKEKRT